MDPAYNCKRKRDGEPLNPIPSNKWSTNVACGDANRKNNILTSPSSLSSLESRSETDIDYASCSTSASSNNISFEETLSQRSNEDTENSPPRKKRNYTKVKRNPNNPGEYLDIKKNSHVGEQTPHSSTKNELFDTLCKPSTSADISIRNEAAFSPQPIRVRDIPLPNVSWTDSSELSLLMCYKEDIGIKERSAYVYRKHPNLNGRMRAILFDWLMEVCDVYKLRRVTYYLAIDYIDRYLSRTDIIPKNHLQLLGITCLFIAAKLEEIYPPKLAELAYVTDGACSDVDMLTKEMSILTTLKWDVNTMTVTGWLCLYLQLACSKSTNIREIMMRIQSHDDDVVYPQFSPYMFMTASMLVDLCSLDDGMLQFKYSVIAASAIYYILNREKALFVSGYTWENIKSCVQWMDPFAVIVAKSLSLKPMIVPREYTRSGSALRTVNPCIVLDEGHSLQNHVVNLTMLEEVYEEITSRRSAYQKGAYVEQTGWSASKDGFYDRQVTDINDGSRREKRKYHRASVYAQTKSRNDSRVYRNTFAESTIELSSEPEHDTFGKGKSDLEKAIGNCSDVLKIIPDVNQNQVEDQCDNIIDKNEETNEDITLKTEDIFDETDSLTDVTIKTEESNETITDEDEDESSLQGVAIHMEKVDNEIHFKVDETVYGGDEISDDAYKEFITSELNNLIVSLEGKRVQEPQIDNLKINPTVPVLHREPEPSASMKGSQSATFHQKTTF